MAVWLAAARERPADARTEHCEKAKGADGAVPGGGSRDQSDRDSELGDREREPDSGRQCRGDSKCNDGVPGPLAIGELTHRGDYEDACEEESGNQQGCVDVGTSGYKCGEQNDYV